MFTYAVHANYGRVCVLVLHARGDGAYTDAQGSDKDKRVVTIEILDSETAGRFDVRTSAFIAGSENLRFGKFFEQQPGGSHSGFRNEHDGRLYVGRFCFHTGYLFL